MAKKIKLNTRSCFIGKRYRDLVKPQREPPLNLTDQGYCADRLAANEPTGQNSKQIFCTPGFSMLIEYAPLVFGTAALLAVFLFFSVPEH
jgi:hypothetical protein